MLILWQWKGKGKKFFLEQRVGGGGLPLGFLIQLWRTQLHSGVSLFSFNEFLMSKQVNGCKWLTVNAEGKTLRRACSRQTGDHLKGTPEDTKKKCLEVQMKT